MPVAVDGGNRRLSRLERRSNAAVDLLLLLVAALFVLLEVEEDVSNNDVEVDGT